VPRSSYATLPAEGLFILAARVELQDVFSFQDSLERREHLRERNNTELVSPLAGGLRV
jgi:hypothetical protein